MPPLVKFTQLREYLREESKKLIAGYALTASNYEEAIRVLKAQYGKPSNLITCYYRELEQMQRSEDPNMQRPILDQIKRIVTNLEQLKATDDTMHLRRMVLKKFSRNILLWIHNVDMWVGDEIPINRLLEALERKVEAVEEATVGERGRYLYIFRHNNDWSFHGWWWATSIQEI